MLIKNVDNKMLKKMLKKNVEKNVNFFKNNLDENNMHPCIANRFIKHANFS